MRKDTIEKRKTFLRHAMGKLFNYLNSKTPESISANADMVFITPEGSVMESLNTCPMTLDHPGREMINVGNLLKRRNRDLCR